MKLLFKLQRSRDFWFLLITSVVFFFLRLPSLFEPYWYGDEGIYEVIGYGLRHGRLLYTGIWDNKPPLLYLLYAISSGDQAPARFLSLIAGLMAVIALFFLGKKLFVKSTPVFIATAFFAFFFGIPLIEGNIANAENFMLLPAILAGLLVWNTMQQKYKLVATNYQLLIAGLLLGLSFLTKIVAVFDLAAFIAFVGIMSLQTLKVKNLALAIKQIIPLIVGFVIPIILCAGFFVAHHTFKEFFHSTLLSNVGYVNYANKFIIPQGFLILKTLLLGALVIVLFVFRKKVSREFLFITLWLGFSIYSSLFSGRPYTHYALVLLPSLSLLLGFVFLKNKLKPIAMILFIATILFLAKSFTYYAHSIRYYGNFLQYVSGSKTAAMYQAFFDGGVPRDYAIADFINAHKKPGDTIFVWGNSGQIYKLTDTLPPGRFIVAYWVQANIPETLLAISQHEPRFIVSLPNEPPVPYSLRHYQQILTIDNATVYEHTF